MGGGIAAAAVVRSEWVYQQLKLAHVHSDAWHEESVQHNSGVAVAVQLVME